MNVSSGILVWNSIYMYTCMQVCMHIILYFLSISAFILYFVLDYSKTTVYTVKTIEETKH